jgi:hypothetical protein
MAGGFLLRAFAILALLAIGEAAYACSASSTYRSVILNSVPENIPQEATVFHIRFHEALYDAKRSEVEGVRGVLLEGAAGLAAGSRVEISGRLVSMCVTWYEAWSDDHDIEDSLLSGYVIGRRATSEDNTVRIEPMIFRSRAHRAERPDAGSWLSDPWKGHPIDPRRTKPDPNAQWVSWRLDADEVKGAYRNFLRLIEPDPRRSGVEGQ